MLKTSTNGRLIEPVHSANMTEVRAGVDAVDRELIELLRRRFAYMDAAARIKTERNIVRDETRKAQVISNAQAAAREAGIPVDAIAAIWDLLVEASIDYELKAWDRLNANPA